MNIYDGFSTTLLIFKPIDINDVPEIHNLRISRKNNFLSQIDDSIENQYRYYEDYKKRNELKNEIYLKIINKKNNEICGFVRITKLLESYTLGWESLIIKEGTLAPIGIEICFTFYYLTFDFLKRSILGPWLVTKENMHMMRIHKHMGFVTEINDINGDKILAVLKENYEKQKHRFIKWGFANEFQTY